MKIRLTVFAFLALVMFSSSSIFAQDRARIEQEILALQEQLTAKEQAFLAPNPEDKIAYAEFLSQPDTGLIRLLPRETYRKRLLIREGGAYYSFTLLTHEYGYGSDIGFERGWISVGFAGADFGFLTSLGSVPIDSVNAETPGLEFLYNFTTPQEEPKAREQQQLTSKGFQIDGHSYGNRLEAKLNTTYALRSINYRDSDVLVAVRIIRQDADGSISLVWKLLKKYPKPDLLRP